MSARAAAIFLVGLAWVHGALGQPHSVRQLAPGVYVWQGDRDNREPANCTWVVFKKFVLVVDANFPWGSREILSKIRDTTDKPIQFVALTHHHGDHSFGNSVFIDAGAAIVSSEATADELRATGPQSWANWNNPAHTLEGARFEPSTITFTDRMIFDDGTQRVELIRLGPAHTRGDAVAFLPKQKIVATGDLCVTWAFGNNVADRGADYDNWLRALDQMISWRPETVVPGHGAPGSTQALQTQRAYLADMLGQVRSGIRAGKSADELAKTVDLRGHGTIANDAEANATSIRAMYRRLSQ
jgi:glyoxylase-like metal-dependent hydrolase (beta-lactamase superfamily II)